MSSKTYDAVFVGSGHNALITAAYLARAGWSVLVLERNDRPGGLVRSEALTRPGFLHDTYSAAHPLFVTSRAYADLGPELEARGLTYLNTDLPTGVLLPDGQGAVLHRDMAAAVAEFERLAPGDGQAFGEMMGELGALAPEIFGLFALDLSSPEAAPLIRKLMVRPDGRPTSFASDFFLTARDVLTRRFHSPVFHALAAPWVMHLGRTPDGANSGFWTGLTLMALMAGGMAVPRGGSEQLARSLVRLIEDCGGEIRTHAPVERIRVKGGRAVAVQVRGGGHEFQARRAVVASVNPDQLYLKLLEGQGVPVELEREARGWRYGRGCVQIHLALSEPPRFADERFDRCGQPHLTSGLDAISQQVDQAIRGLLPSDPVVSLDISTNLDPSRAPEGQAILRLQMLEIPCRPQGDAAGEIEVGDGSWTKDLERRFADRVLGVVARHLPKVPETIVGMHIVSPDDLARFSPNQGPGDPYAGSHDLAQSYIFRPLPGQPGHRTVVPNLFLLGAATWPGHGVNGGSGYIVAQQLLGEESPEPALAEGERVAHRALD
jgi:phytoene dehydrogenase-like protein